MSLNTCNTWLARTVTLVLGAAACQALAQPAHGGRAVGRIAPHSVQIAQGPAADTAGGTPAAASPASVVRALTSEGFENVRVARTPDGLRIAFENRLYRWDVDALRRAMQLVSRVAGPDERLTFQLRREDLPVFELSFLNHDYQDFAARRTNARQFRRRLRVSENVSPVHGRGANLSFGRVDLTEGFGIRATLTRPGSGRGGIQVQDRLGLQSTLARGLFARVEQVIPFNSGGFGGGSFTRQGAVALTGRTGNLFLTGSAGRFDRNTDGVRFNGALIPSEKQDVFTLDAGLMSRPGESGQHPYALGGLTHKIAGVDADVSILGGRYLFGDTGFTVGFDTAFRQTDMRLAYTRSSFQNILSLGFSIPLPPDRYSRPRGFRLRTARDFAFTYSAPAGNSGVEPAAFGFTGDPRNLLAAATLDEYIDYLRPGPGDTQRGVQAHRPSLLISPSSAGSTGLISIPIAAVQPYGWFAIGANYVNRQHRYVTRVETAPGAFNHPHGTVAQYLEVGVLPRVEFTARVTNEQGKIGIQDIVDYSTVPPTNDVDIDRMVSAQWLVSPESARRPGILIGAQDVSPPSGDFGTSNLYRADYVVASRHLGRLGLHAGLGTDRLRGLFGGVDYAVNRRLDLMLDADSRAANFGLRGEPLPNIRLDLYFPGLDSVGGGVAFIVHG